MDYTRLAVLVALACGALVDILILAHVMVTGGLAFALDTLANPKAIAIVVLMAACFAAPPVTFSFFRKGNYVYAFIAVCVPMAFAILVSRFGA